MPATSNAVHDTPAPINTPSEAEQVAHHFEQVMESLLNVVEEETRLVREGRLKEAVELNQPKADLARLYLADATRMKSANAFMRQRLPELLESMRRRHDTFRALLQINLTVLATAHAVSEGLVRGVSAELARKAAPQTYGAPGRTNAPPPSATQPLAVSRQL